MNYTDFPEIDFFEDTLPAPLDSKPRESTFTRALNTIAQRYPRIHVQVTTLWGTQELQDRFTRWLLTDQHGRCGWASDMYSALLEVANTHAQVFNLSGDTTWSVRPDKW